MANDERRTEPRVDVDLHVVELDEHTTYFQYATDLSAGGMFLFGTGPHTVGSQVTLLFKLPGDQSMTRLPAEVVGNTELPGKRGTHIRFVGNDSSEERTRVRAFVRARDPATSPY